MRSDLIIAFRSLARNSGFATLAALMIALGISVNTTIYSLANALIFAPPPFDHPEQLVLIQSTNPSVGVRSVGVSFADIEDRGCADTRQGVPAHHGVQPRELQPRQRRRGRTRPRRKRLGRIFHGLRDGSEVGSWVCRR
jgi:hypothetical protein